MCVSPCYLSDMTEVACRYCWQCKQNRINDLVGRCIAEQKYSRKTYAVTLTYSKKAGVNAVTLVYRDVQVFLRRLKRRYGKLRYICAGEYGSDKGRAHWHIALFFKERYPEPENMPQLRFGEKLPPNEHRVDWEPWEHGFSYFQEPQFSGDNFKYLMKYAIKNQDLDSSDKNLTMSKYPPLGHEFFMELARTHVEQAVIPRSFMYKIGGVKKSNGKEKTFFMQGKTRDNFMTAFKEGWKEKYGKEPTSEFFEEWDEKNYEVTYNDEELMERLHRKDVRYFQPWKTFVAEEQGTWTERQYQGIDLVMWEHDNKIWIYGQDGQSWHEERSGIVDAIKERSTISKQMSYNEAQRDELERLWKLLEETTPEPERPNYDQEFR